MNIIEKIAHKRFDEKGFNGLIDPEGSLDKDSRRKYWDSFESAQQNLISFYRSLEGEKSEVDYIKRSINSFFDQLLTEGADKQNAEEKRTASSDKIKPIDDLEGSDSWGYNDDVKWK